MVVPKTDIILYTAGTPNGQKASITLEELGLNYEVKKINMGENVQKEDWFLRINPNGRIPAMIDRTPTPDGKSREKRIFESGAMMLYLCQKYDLDNKISYPYDSDKYWEVVEWLVWMQSGLGPMQVRRRSTVFPDMNSEQHRDKPTTSTVTPQRRLSTESNDTRPRPSDYIKSSKIVSKINAKTIVRQPTLEQLVPRDRGSLGTE